MLEACETVTPQERRYGPTAQDARSPGAQQAYESQGDRVDGIDGVDSTACAVIDDQNERLWESQAEADSANQYVGNGERGDSGQYQTAIFSV